MPGFYDVHYFAQSIYEPSAFIVPGFNPGMPVINKPPIGLTDDEILAVIAYLQSLGGKTTVTMQTKLPCQAGGNGEAAGHRRRPGGRPDGGPAATAAVAPAPQNAGKKPETEPQDRDPGSRNERSTASETAGGMTR